jgi:hypothetical protein
MYTGQRELGQQTWNQYARIDRVATKPPSPFIVTLAHEFGLEL